MGCGCNKTSSPSNKPWTNLGPLKFHDCGCGCKGQVRYDTFMISLLSGILFYVFAHPKTFMFVRDLAGNWVSSASGCPSLAGLLLHSFVFLLITWGLMNIKNLINK